MHWWPISHLVATFGNYKMLELFLTFAHDHHFDEDEDRNTPLHCIMRDDLSIIDKSVNIQGNQSQTHLLDYVSCQHLFVMTGER